MNLVRRAGGIFLHANVYISVYALLLSGATAVLLPPGWPVPLAVYGLVGGGTLAAYNYHALVHQTLAHPGLGMRTRLPDSLRCIQRACITVGGVLAGLSLMRLPPVVWTLAAALGILTILYSTPMFAFGKKRRLKDFGGLKWVVLVAVWTLATTLIPAVGAGLSMPDALMVLQDEIIVRALLLLPLCLAFDIRDEATDRAAGIRTVAVRMGPWQSQSLLAALFIVFAVINAEIFSGFPPFAVMGICVAGYGLLAAYAALRSGGEAFAYLFWLDGTLALYAASRIIVAWPAA